MSNAEVRRQLGTGQGEGMQVVSELRIVRTGIYAQQPALHENTMWGHVLLQDDDGNAP